MEYKIRIFLFTAIMGLAFTNIACPPPEPQGNVHNAQTSQEAQNILTQDVENVLTNSQMSDAQKADEIAYIGKSALASPVGFTMAHAVFKEAKKVNPKNARAEFYSILLEALMSFKGIVKETKEGLTDKSHQKLVDQFSGDDQKEIKEFLLEGSAPTGLKLKNSSPSTASSMIAENETEFEIKKPSHIQDLLELRLIPIFLKLAQDLDIFFLTHADFVEEIYIPQFVVGKDENTFWIVFDKAAYLAFRGMIYVAVSTIKLAVSYDFDDAKAIEAGINALGDNAPLTGIINVIKDYPKFATLRKVTYLNASDPNRIQRSLEEVYNSFDNLYKLLTEKSEGRFIRKTNYDERYYKFIPNLEPSNSHVQDTKTLLIKFHEVINGPVTFTELGKNHDKTLTVDLSAFLTNRNQKFNNLKTFLPTFDSEQMQLDYQLGGLFPTGDLQRIISGDYGVEVRHASSQTSGFGTFMAPSFSLTP